MNLRDNATRFSNLHVKGSPVLLYNAWDAGSARAIANAGAKAIGTSSWAVSAAQGYADGEELPLTDALTIVRRIASSLDVPLTVDIEGGYGADESELSENVARFLELGIAGVNFEDRVVRGEGLYTIERQSRRIAAVRAAADRAGVPLFINARTDLFLGRGTPNPSDSIPEAIDRAAAYASAGASGFFVPGLIDERLIARVSERVSLPVNIMVMDGAPPIRRLGELGIARISWGNIPYVESMRTLQRVSKGILNDA